MATNVARRLAQLTKGLGEIDRTIVAVAGQIISDELLDQVRRDTGGDGALSGIGGGKYKLDIELSPLRSPVGVRIRPKSRQSGMWAIVSKGTSAHEIRAKPRRKQVRKLKRTASRARAVRVGGAWRAGPWRVSGSRGKNTWTHGRDKGFDLAVKAAFDEVRRVVSGGR